MFSFLTKPRVFWIGLIVQTAIMAAVYLSMLLSGSTQLSKFAVYFPAFSESLAYLVAGLLNFKISQEYKSNNLMRFAWIFLGLNAIVSIGRDVISLPWMNALWENYFNSALQIRQHEFVILIANLFLLSGLTMMWAGFKKSGLGFTIGIRGYIEVLCILILTVALLLTVPFNPFPIGLIILSIASMVGVVLHKMAIQMGGGKLATALQFLTLYTLARAVFVLIEHSLGLNFVERRQTIDALMAADLLLWRFIPWIAALAAAYRAELTVHARKELNRQRIAEPAKALA